MYNIYDELNRVINYIEEHILEDIDTNSLAKLIGLNINALKSIFSCLTGVSIAEYIRLRRLSLSVTDIVNGDSITSVSYKYLYNSPSSYNRAFKKYEGITPSKLKDNTKELKLFNKIILKEKVIDYTIDYKIYKNKTLHLFGVAKHIDLTNKTKEIPAFWKAVKNVNPEFIDNKRYGFLNKDSNYYCLLEKEFKNSKLVHIATCNYFAIRISSFESQSIIHTIKKCVTEYITSLNYKLLNLPNIEVYYKDYVEILIPIT